MRRFLVRIFSLLVFLCAFQALSNEGTRPEAGHQIVLGKIVGREINRNVYLELSAWFQKKHPDKRLLIKGWKDDSFKASLDALLHANQIDIVHAPSGSRMCELAARGRLKNLDNFWQIYQLENAFNTHLIHSLKCENTQIAIPLLYYYWGFFYKKSLFEQLQLSEPGTWAEFKNVIRKLNQHQKIPIVMGAKYHWPAISWMSYVNLRLHGIEYHRALAKGQVAFDDIPFRQTLSVIKEVVELDGFIDGFEDQTRNTSLPLLYRNYAGMVLSGSFLLNQIPAEIRKDIGFFPFPVINPDIPRYEEVPVDGIYINASMDEGDNLASVLSFLSDKNVQQWFSNKLGYLPAHRKAVMSSDPLLSEGAELVYSAVDMTQYFDRDALPELAEKVPVIFTDFLVNPDIDKTVQELEALRQSLLPQSGR